jgi:GNAT superfamily N-acetyltransferase
MKFSPSQKENLASIMSIIHDAQVYLAYQNIDQWQDGYPNEKAILTDISNGASFVVKNEDDTVLATAMFTTKPEPTYTNINGNWLTAKNAIYGVIHRMAVGRAYRKLGTAKFILNECEQKLKENKVPSMRIDTHEDNKGMQNLLKKSDYVFCGVIILVSGATRLAFEKLLK